MTQSCVELAFPTFCATLTTWSSDQHISYLFGRRSLVKDCPLRVWRLRCPSIPLPKPLDRVATQVDIVWSQNRHQNHQPRPPPRYHLLPELQQIEMSMPSSERRSGWRGNPNCSTHRSTHSRPVNQPSHYDVDNADVVLLVLLLLILMISSWWSWL